MKDKKHIDELFKERFKNFEATPSPEVWKNIQAGLKKEEDDRKVVPLWIRWSGVAAILALLLLGGNFVFDPFGPDSNDAITTEDTNEQLQDKEVVKDNTFTQNEEIASEDENEDAGDTKRNGSEELNSDSPSQENIVNGTETNRDAVANQEIEEQKAVKKTNEEILRDPRIKKDAIESIKETGDATAVSEDGTTSEKDKEIKDESNPITKETAIEKDAAVGVADTDVQKSNKDDEDLIKRDIDIIDSDTPVVAAVEKEGAEKADEEQIKEDEEADKPSLIDVVNEQNTEKAVAKKDAPDKRWEVAPNVGPVYYDSFGEGSSIDPSFSDNPQSSDINFSYGVAVSYNISDRLSVRSGINNVRLSYSTGGVELADAPVGIALRSVDYGGRQNVVTAVDAGTIAMTPSGSPLDNLQPKSGGGNPEISQRINYFEVPLEMRYALTEGKFGINMIGGFSTLFLGSNEISVQDGSFSSTLGEANNLNSLSFSTNIGLGFDYNISRSLRFNIEPIFKYQLNPYSDSSVNFRPYIFGVYSGLSFKF